MNILRGIIAEVVHLFVDSGSLALALVIWCAAVRVATAILPRFPGAMGPVLFVGCAAILLINITRAARRTVPGKPY
jgi:hypothetical protein